MKSLMVYSESVFSLTQLLGVRLFCLCCWVHQMELNCILQGPNQLHLLIQEYTSFFHQVYGSRGSLQN